MMEARFEVFSECIVEINRYLQRIKEAEMQKLGLHAKHTMCLYYLGKNPRGLTPTELTRLCSEDKAAISRSLIQLENSGYVIREPSLDKRAYRLVYNLTPLGEETVKSINRKVDAALFSGGSGLDDQRREIFYSSLQLILNNLKNYLEEMKSEEN